MEAYKSTGYPRGRPRKGELRPPSPNAIRVAAYRKARVGRDPNWKKKLAEYQKRWYWSHLERSREISRDSMRRRKAWKQVRPEIYNLIEVAQSLLSS